MKRVKQVLAAITAKITVNDETFVEKWLNPAERELFWAMNLPDQRHALNVAYTALALAKQYQRQRVDQSRLVRCCLLHDIGKVKGDVSTMDKILLVLCQRIMPRGVRRWQSAGKGNFIQNFRHALYIYEYHPQIGAAKLRQIGQTNIADIIAKHHQLQQNDDPLELIILREADELN